MEMRKKGLSAYLGRRGSNGCLVIRTLRTTVASCQIVCTQGTGLEEYRKAPDLINGSRGNLLIWNRLKPCPDPQSLHQNQLPPPPIAV